MTLGDARVQGLAIEALQRLNVDDTVHVVELRLLSYGLWLVSFADGSPLAGSLTFDIGIHDYWSPEQAADELRSELRKKLWICPLCQRRAEIHRLPNHQAVRVECGHCGTFDMGGALVDHLRQAHDDGVAGVVERLSRLSAYVQQASLMPYFSIDNWLVFADGA